MDYRFETKALAFLAGAILLAGMPLAGAQTFQVPEYEDEPLSEAQRNPELPKGLTFVPWKIERRGENANEQKADQRELQVRPNR